MNSMKYKILSLLLLFVMSFVSTYLQAAVTQKGVGFSNLKSGCNNQNRPRERGVHEETFEKAKLQAWKKFISTLEDDARDTYEDNKSTFINNLDEYFLDLRILSQECSKQSRSYELIVRVSIDDGAFRGAMSRASGQVSAGGSLAGQTTIIMIYPRKVDKATSFDDRKTVVVDKKNSFVADEVSEVSDSSASITENSRSISATTTGGSTVKGSEKRIYRLGDRTTAQSISSRALRRMKMRAAFPAQLKARAGRMGVDASFVDRLEAEFLGPDGNYSFDTLAELELFSMDVGIYQYLIIGSVDLSNPRIDQQSGLPRVTAMVNFELYECTMDGNFLLSSSNESYIATAETEQQAEAEALKKAVSEAVPGLFYNL